MAEVRARDSNTCQFWLRLVVWAQESGAVYFPNRPNVDGARLLQQARLAFCLEFDVTLPECSGPLDGQLCNVHNTWTDLHKPEARILNTDETA